MHNEKRIRRNLCEIVEKNREKAKISTFSPFSHLVKQILLIKTEKTAKKNRFRNRYLKGPAPPFSVPYFSEKKHDFRLFLDQISKAELSLTSFSVGLCLDRQAHVPWPPLYCSFV